MEGSFNLAHVPQEWNIGLLAFPPGAFLLSCVCCDGLGTGRELIFVATCLWCPEALRDVGGRAGMVQRNILHPTGAVVAFSLPGGDSFFCESVPFSFLIFGYWPEREFSKPLVCITLADLLLLHESLPMD